MPRELHALAGEIREVLGIPREEAELYVTALVKGGCSPSDQRTRSTAASLSARGMFILDSDGRRYLAVHPRLALSNLFRAYEEKASRERKEKRLLVDKLTLELIPLLPGETKGTNPGSPGGKRAA